MKIYGGIKHNVPKAPELSRENVLTKLIATNRVWVLEKNLSLCPKCPHSISIRFFITNITEKEIINTTNSCRIK